MPEINSRDYWETRFQTDWEERGGPEQSRFFARLAVDHLPDWFGRLERAETFAICDWGCAAGDGTSVLAEHLPHATVVGVDFSAAAIERARRKFPELEFRCADYLGEHAGDSYDVMFCSNTLEHFADPWDVFQKIGRHARRFCIVLVPFREPDHRIEPEHMVSFDYRDVTLRPHGDWYLVHSSVVDAASYPETRWPGEQIVLVYARGPEVGPLALSLADLCVDSAPGRRPLDQAERELSDAADRLRENERELEQARAELAAKRSWTRELEDRCDLLQAEVGRLGAELERLQSRFDAVAAESARLDSAIRTADAALGRPPTELPDDDTESPLTRAQVAEQRLRELAEHLSAMRRSLIWRLTEPIRRLLGFVRSKR